MRIRSLLFVTAFVASILGAAVVWLVLTVPNDIAAEALLKQARENVEARNNDKARAALSKIVQQYPRTDAAAAATVALITLGDQERQKLAAELDTVRKDRAAGQAAEQAQLTSIQQKLDKIAAAPPPAPVVAAAPAEKAPVPAKKKTTPPKRSRKKRQH